MPSLCGVAPGVAEGPVPWLLLPKTTPPVLGCEA